MLGFDLTDEQKALADTARKFAREEIMPVAARCDEAEEFPLDVFKQAWSLGLCNVELSPAHGGVGLGCLDHVLILEELNYACAGITTSLEGTSLATLPLLVAGSDEQRAKYLGWLAREPVMAAYACSEPDAGSDVAALSTRVRMVGDEYVLDGQKRWITNGGLASWYVVFATRDRSLRHKGISCFVVDRDTPGIKVGRKEVKLGQRASNTTDVLFEEVKLTQKNLVGEEGQGFKIAMRSFDRSRPWIAAGAAGIIRRCLDESRRYALERKTFGVPIAQHQAVQFMLAEMAAETYAMESIVYRTAWMCDSGMRFSRESAMCKYLCTELLDGIVDRAVQLHGGMGYSAEMWPERFYRDSRINRIFEGTNEIQRVVIARDVLKKGGY